MKRIIWLIGLLLSATGTQAQNPLAATMYGIDTSITNKTEIKSVSQVTVGTQMKNICNAVNASYKKNTDSTRYNTLTGAPTALPPNGGAGGSLSGSYPNPGLASNSVGVTQINASGAMAGQVLGYNGTSLVWTNGVSGGDSNTVQRVDDTIDIKGNVLNNIATIIACDTCAINVYTKDNGFNIHNDMLVDGAVTTTAVFGDGDDDLFLAGAGKAIHINSGFGLSQNQVTVNDTSLYIESMQLHIDSLKTGADADSAIVVHNGNIEKVERSSIVTNSMITTAKVADSAVTSVKIKTGAVQTGHIAAGAVTHATLAAASVDASNLAINTQTITPGGISCGGIAFSIFPYFVTKGNDTITATNIQVNDANYHTISLLPTHNGDIRYVTRTGGAGIITIIPLKQNYAASTIANLSQILIQSDIELQLKFDSVSGKWSTQPGLPVGTSGQFQMADGSLASGTTAGFSCTGFAITSNSYTGNHTWNHDLEFGMTFYTFLHPDTLFVTPFNNFGFYARKGEGIFPLVIMPVSNSRTTYLDSSTSPVIIKNIGETRIYELTTSNGSNFSLVTRYPGIDTAGGDLTGIYPNPTIAATSAVGSHIVSSIAASTSIIPVVNLGTGGAGHGGDYFLRANGTWGNTLNSDFQTNRLLTGGISLNAVLDTSSNITISPSQYTYYVSCILHNDTLVLPSSGLATFQSFQFIKTAGNFNVVITSVNGIDSVTYFVIGSRNDAYIISLSGLTGTLWTANKPIPHVMTPTITPGTGMGTSPSGISVTGNDNRYVVTWTQGTSGATNATLFTTAFANSFTTVPISLIIGNDLNGRSISNDIATPLSTTTPTGQITQVGATALTAGTTYSMVVNNAIN